MSFLKRGYFPNEKNRKNAAGLEYLEEETGTLDLKQILSSLLLANDRTASKGNVDPDTWRWDYLNQGAFALLEIARLISGNYYCESEFYDTSALPISSHLVFLPEISQNSSIAFQSFR